MKHFKSGFNIFGYRFTPLFWKICISMALIVCITVFAMMDFPAPSVSVASASDSYDDEEGFDEGADGQDVTSSGGLTKTSQMQSGKPTEDSQASSDSDASNSSSVGTTMPGTVPPSTDGAVVSGDAISSGEESAPKGVFYKTAFIGDSRTEGLLLYSGVKDVAGYAIKGLNVKTVFSNAFISTSSGKRTVIEDMKDKSFEKIYISFGLNELGWNIDTYIKKYTELVATVREIQPDAAIYIQSTIPINPDRCKFDGSTNDRIKVMNDNIKGIADSFSNVYYIELYPKFQDERGYLDSEASSDGIHLNKKFCTYWLKCLEDNLTAPDPINSL